MAEFVQMADTIGQNVSRLAAFKYWQDRLVASYTTRTYQATDAQFAEFKHPVRIDQAPTDDLARAANVKDVEAGAASIRNAVNAAKEGFHFVTYLPEKQNGYSLAECRAAMKTAGIKGMTYWVANWNLNEAQAAARLGGDIVAFQWASPTSNPNTKLPGTSLTLKQANVDLSVVTPGLWMADPDAKPPKGTWHAELIHHMTPTGGTWKVQPLPGENVEMGDTAEWDYFAGRVNRHTGHWEVAGEPRPRPKVADRVPGHPELLSAISRIVNQALAQWPGLVITSTTGGSHAEGSYHYQGRAADLGTEPFDKGYQDRAAAWISGHLRGKLTEGIHNPSLSVKNGTIVPSSHWGAQTWKEHANHIHLAA